MIKFKKMLISKKTIGIIKNNLNKMKILVMNSITFKIPILTATYYLYTTPVKIGILCKCNRIHYQYLHLA